MCGWFPAWGWSRGPWGHGDFASSQGAARPWPRCLSLCLESQQGAKAGGRMTLMVLTRFGWDLLASNKIPAQFLESQGSSPLHLCLCFSQHWAAAPQSRSHWRKWVIPSLCPTSLCVALYIFVRGVCCSVSLFSLNIKVLFINILTDFPVKMLWILISSCVLIKLILCT